MKIEFNWIGGATFILSIDNLKIAVDPVLCEKGTIQDYFWFKSKRIEDPMYELEDFRDIDFWLITHDHEDHLDKDGLDVIEKDSIIISNKNASKKLNTKSFSDLTILNWGQNKTIRIKDFEINIEAIPAIHGVNPISALLAGKGNGYYVNIKKDEQKFKFYLTGDTIYNAKTINALVNKKIDLLIPNMGAASQRTWIMTLTLNAKMLKKLIEKLNPKKVIPVHYGTFKHYKEPVEKIIAIADNRIEIVNVGETLIIT